LELTDEDIRYPNSYQSTEHAENVVVFDDASASGYSVRQMMEVAERSKAKCIFVYLLCNRSERSVSRSIQKIQRYGVASVHVRFLSEFPIPTYSPANCPVCKMIERFEKLKQEVRDVRELVTCIEYEMNLIQEQPISLVMAEGTSAPFVSTPIEERVLERVFVKCCVWKISGGDLVSLLL
jgi:hypothetical protein